MKKVLKAVALTAAAALAVSCGSTKVAYTEEEFNQAFADEDYGACASMIRSQKDKKNAVLNSLDADMLLYLNGDYLDSAKAFMDTQSLMQQVTKDTSGGKAFAATMAGENSVTYAGTTYERILAYSMRAVNALALGDVSNAKGVMDNYTGDYKDIIAPFIAEQKELAAQSEESPDDEGDDDSSAKLEVFKKNGLDIEQYLSDKPAASDKLYETSPFLSYLGTVIYAANGDAEHAADFASALAAENTSVDVSEDVAVPAGKGRLDVVALSGTIGKRTENDFPATQLGLIDGIPIMVKFAYPVFGPQKHAINAVRVTLSDGTEKTATLVEDFDEAVKTDVEFKASGAFSRSFTRNLVKLGGAIVALESAKVANEANNNKMTQMALTSAQVALPKTVDLLVNAEKADVRQGAYFPHKASAAGFTVEPGTYSVKVEYLSDSTVVETKELSNIVVSAGKPTVVVSSCAK